MTNNGGTITRDLIEISNTQMPGLDQNFLITEKFINPSEVISKGLSICKAC